MNNDPIHSLVPSAASTSIPLTLPLLHNPFPKMVPPVESSLSLTITKEGLQLTVALSIWRDPNTPQRASPRENPGTGSFLFGGTR